MDIYEFSFFNIGRLIEAVIEICKEFFLGIGYVFSSLPDLINTVMLYIDLLPPAVKVTTLMSLYIAFCFAFYGFVIKIVKLVVDLIL